MMKYLAGALVFLLGVAAANAQEPITFPRPSASDFDAAALDEIDVASLPVIPELTETAQAIYAYGQTLGNHPQRFSKIGDCMTASPEFLTPFGGADYDLGDYEEALRPVLEYFDVPARDDADLNSFGLIGIGTASGFNTATLTDPLFADPAVCDPNESSLLCEYRLTKPAFALMMLGTNDVMFFEAAAFDFAMRTIVLDTIEQGIVPVLYTIPWRPEFPEKVENFNAIIALIARDYDLPLINLSAAIADLPSQGVDAADPIHLSEPEGVSTGVFNTATLQYGYPVRNLITLQTLAGFLETLEDAG
jgi:hypothetical protein